MAPRVISAATGKMAAIPIFFFQAEDGIRDLYVTGVPDVCSSDLERSAVLLGVLDRGLSRRRITGVDVLLIECEATVVALEEIAQPDAQVGAVGARFRAGERQEIGRASCRERG